MKEQVDKWTGNEVEPRPNEENTDRVITLALRKSRRDDTLLTVCFSLRRTNDVSDYVIAKGDGARTVSTTANDQRNHINQMKIKVQTMTALIGQFPASAHFQFSIFNFQLI
jgi:hypothetical protein